MGGYHRCCVPGCRTRINEGKIFKKFPMKNEELAQKWLERLPAGMKVSNSSAVCEDHFDPSAFERPRQDGTRKFRGNAVPSFQDCSITSSLKTPMRKCQSVPRRPLAVLSDNSTNTPNHILAASALVELASHCQPEQIEIIGTPAVHGQTESSPYTPSSIEHDAWILDDKTGEWLQPVNCYNSDESTDDNVLNSSQCFLDEVTGFLTPLRAENSRTDSQTEVESQNSPHSDAKEALLKLEKDVLVEMVLETSTQLENTQKLVEAQQEQLKRTSDCDLNGAFGSTKYLRLYHAERSARARVEKKLKMYESASPWLTASQVDRMFRKTNRGKKWTMEEIRLGLIMKMKCGTSGYSAFVQQFKFLPAVRTLQKSVQFVRFDSGLLHEIFDLMEMLAKNMPDYEKDCQVVLDELAITPGTRYCNSLKKFVGNSTLSSHAGLASKALVIILAGISTRWKLAVAVELTNKKSEESKLLKNGNLTGKAYCKIINSVIEKSEKIGLKVAGVTSDMGADNLAFWREYGVTGSRSQKVVSSIRNPCRDSNIFILPDAVHVMKSIKGMLETNTTVSLPPDVVAEEGLPSAVVDYTHIRDLYEFESGYELKVAFRLREDNIDCKKQFKTMNVGSTKAVICHRTGVGLQRMAQEKQERTYETTAWFVILLNTFFTLVTCRNRGLAISRKNLNAYDKAIALIKRMSYIFQNMKIGKDGTWKPVQRGVVVLCNSLLGLIEYFLVDRGFDYLMLGRFTGDCIENLFSVIRLTQAIPDAATLLLILKVVTLAQYSQAVKGSSYEYEDCSSLPSIDFLEEALKRAKERANARFAESLEELMENPVKSVTEEDLKLLDTWERMVVYDMAGSVVAAIKRSLSHCNECVSALLFKGPGHHPFSDITEMKEFTLLRSDARKGPTQIAVSDVVFNAVLKAEVTFRLYRAKSASFKSTDVKQFFVESLMYVWHGSGIPGCHSITRKILNVFLDGRLKEFGKKTREDAKKAAAPQRSSKSVAMHQAADEMTVTKSHTK